MKARLYAVAATVAAQVTATHAADKVTVGFIATLSGPNGSPGVEVLRGIHLAPANFGDKIRCLRAAVVVKNDQPKPDVAHHLADKPIRSDHVGVITRSRSLTQFKSAGRPSMA